MVSVLKGHSNIKNKTFPAILAQKTDHYVAWKNNFCAPTPAPHNHLSKSHWACEHAEIIHAIAADAKKIKMLKKYREISWLLGKEKGYYKEREATESKTKNQTKANWFSSS